MEAVAATATVMKELSETREEVDRAREAAVQAWLASMPLGEELEKLRGELTTAQTRLAARTAEIVPLRSLIESTNNAVRGKQEEEEEKREAMEELQSRIDSGRAELRRLRSEIGAGKEAKDVLEQQLFIRRQAAQRLQLTKKAVVMEIIALTTSVDTAIDVIKSARADDNGRHHDVVAMPPENLAELRKNVEAEVEEAELRVEEGEEFRASAKAGKAAAAERLAALRVSRRQVAQARHRHGIDARGEHGDGKGPRRGQVNRMGRRLGVKRLLLLLKKVGCFLCKCRA